MKKIFLLLLSAGSFAAKAQLSANILVPPSGLMDKQQLWNILLTNTEAAPLSVQIQVSFSEISTGQPVFTASAGPLLLAPGILQLSSLGIGPIQYNIVNPAYSIDPGPSGLLPVGTFNVCYNFLIVKQNRVVQECQQVNVPPLGPLLLSQPSNGATIQQLNPLFTWLPPSMANTPANLRFDLRLVEVMPNQSAADALQQNIPLYEARQLATPTLLYSPSAPVLLEGKTYAWQVIATNNFSELAKSESWSFSIKGDPAKSPLKATGSVFVKLKKAGGQDGYVICTNQIRFDYLNETADSTWNVMVDDLSSSRHISFALAIDSVRLARGQNLVSYPASDDRRFIDKHQYLLRLINSRGETWQLRFEYRKQD